MYRIYFFGFFSKTTELLPSSFYKIPTMEVFEFVVKHLALFSIL